LIGPILYQRAGDASDSKRNLAVHQYSWKLSSISLFITAGAFVFAATFHRLIFSIFVASAFQDVSKFLPWMVLAGGLFATGQILGLKLMTERRHHLMVSTKIATALFGIAANIVGAWLYGMSGIVPALVMFSIAYYCAMALLARGTRQVES
jgi:O-antigen/teichoic acid export membrane protein